MDVHLEDLRILRLARMYEHAYESFVQTVASEHLDDETRALLAPLAPERDRHEERVQEAIDRIERSMPAGEERALMRSVLLDVVEVERAAREFYLDHLDRVHDKDAVRLFHELAAEEARHVEVAERALDALGPVASAREAPDDERVPAWEGTSDMRARKRRRAGGRAS
jgi:rubrerythrin